MMQWSANPYFVPMLVAGFLGLINVLFVTRRLKVAGALQLLGMGLAGTGWAFAYAMELASSNLNMQIFWGKIQYFGIVAVSVSFFLFTLNYSQAKRFIESKLLNLVWLFPVVCVALVWTNESHHLIWTEIVQKDYGSFVMAVFGHGPVFWAFVAYSYVMLFSGTIVLFVQAFRSPPEFRAQAFILVFGVLINWIGNIVYISGANPVPDLDWTPMGIILSGIIYAVALFQFRFLDLVPVAGETVLESMSDVVIVLDDKSRVVYLNNAFEYFFLSDPRAMIGLPVSVAFAYWPDLLRLCNQHNTTRSELVVKSRSGEPVFFDVRVSNIRWRKSYSMGRVIVLDDVTEQKQAEARAALHYEVIARDGKSESLPLFLMYRAVDEMIIEANRSLLLYLGFDRMKVLGRTMIEARIWEPFLRAEFLRAFNQEHSLKSYPLTLKHYNGTDRRFAVTAQFMDVSGTGYVILLAQPQIDVSA